jgi:hypothetical protein
VLFPCPCTKLTQLLQATSSPQYRATPRTRGEAPHLLIMLPGDTPGRWWLEPLGSEELPHNLQLSPSLVYTVDTLSLWSHSINPALR